MAAADRGSHFLSCAVTRGASNLAISRFSFLEDGVKKILGTIFALGALLSAPALSIAHGDDEIIVNKHRDKKSLEGGEWLITVSRSYRFGKSLDGDGTTRAAGRDLSYRFCLSDTEIEIFVRKLVGEGQSEVAGTTVCRPLQMRSENGKVRASQTCEGGNVTIPGENQSLSRTYPTRLILTVTGKYSSTDLTLDFENRRELIVLDAAQLNRPDFMRWSIKGNRVGQCQLSK
jgi:hypothetical protein